MHNRLYTDTTSGAANFSTAIMPTIPAGGTSSANGDRLTFSNTAASTQTDDITSALNFNALTFNNTGALTLVAGAGTSITLGATTGGTNPVLTFNPTAVTDPLGLVLASNTTFFGAGPSNGVSGGLQITGVISGAGTLTKTGLAALSIGGTNTYTGTTTIENGTIVASNASALGTAATVFLGDATTLANGYTVVLEENGATTNPKNIMVGVAGANTSGSIYNLGSGNNGSAATYSGTITLNQNLIFSDPSAGTSLITVSGSVTSGTSGTQTLTFLNNTHPTTVSGVIGGGTGTIAVVKAGTGPGTLTLSGANTYTGTTTVNEGTLTLRGSLSASSALVLGGGTFNYTAGAGQTLAGTTINQGNSVVTSTTSALSLGAITHNAGGLVSFTGAGTINTTSPGTNGILGPYAYTGTTTTLSYVTPTSPIAAYTGGTAAATAANVTDTTGTVNYNVAAGGTVGTGASANTLRYTGAADTITGPVTLNSLMNAGTGLLTVSGTVTAGATNELDILSNASGVTLSAAVADNGANPVSLAYGGPAAGTLALVGANTYTGGTTSAAGGTLTLSGAGTLGGATFANAVAYTGAINDTGAFVDSSSSNQTLSGVISGAAGTVTQNGPGTLTLAGANTYTGATTVNGGKLRLTNTTGSGTGTGTVSVSGATTTFSGTGTSSGALTVTNSGRLAPGVNTSGNNGNFGVAGTLTAGQGGMTLTSASLDFDLSGNAVTAGAGINDLIMTSGTLALTPASDIFTFNELTPGTLLTGTNYTLIMGQSGVTGDPTALAANTLFVGGTNYTAAYSLDGSNNLLVQFSNPTPAPEPSQFVAFGLGCAWTGRTDAQSPQAQVPLRLTLSTGPPPHRPSHAFRADPYRPGSGPGIPRRDTRDERLREDGNDPAHSAFPG